MVTAPVVNAMGAPLSTLKVVEGLDAAVVLPAASEATPAATVIPNVPFPVIELMVTVAPVAVTPETAIVPSAVEVLFKVIFPAAKVEPVAPEYVMVYVTGPVFAFATLGALIEIVGGILSTLKVVEALDAAVVLPAASEATPAATVMPNVPSPVIELMVTVAPVAVTPETPIVPSAVKVLFKVIFPAAKVEPVAPEYVMVYVTGTVFVLETLGEPTEIVGAVLSIINVEPLSVPVLELPAISVIIALKFRVFPSPYFEFAINTAFVILTFCVVLIEGMETGLPRLIYAPVGPSLDTCIWIVPVFNDASLSMGTATVIPLVFEML